MPTISGGPQARDCRVAEDRAVCPPAGPRRRHRAGALEGEKRSREARRERLELPSIDREMLKTLLDNFDKVMAEGPNPKKKHLLHRLVKKVLIHSRKTVEIWYVLPNSQRFANCNIWLPKCPALLTARWTPRCGSESSTSPRLATLTPLWPPTANK